MRRSREQGAVAPLVAILMIVIVICVALVVDLGHLHNVKIELQRAVDAAALTGARYLPDADRVVATTTASAGANFVDGSTLQDLLTNETDATSLTIVLGGWDKDALGASADSRFDSTATNPDAVLVQASRDVDHVFFFFVDSTQVTADAIAVAEPINPVMPLSLVSCIPLQSIQNNPGMTPGTQICDIGYYTFADDTNDTAAWTSLTLDPNSNDIRDLLSGSDGRKLFEQVVFGQGLPNNGIENTAPTPGSDCNPQDFNINCGLGQIGSTPLAAPSDFPIPAGFPNPPQDLVKDANGVYQPVSTSFNPALGYGLNGALPRWYNSNANSVLQSDDHFTRIWSLDGLLLPPIPTSPAPVETFTAYQNRLADYYNSFDPGYTPQGTSGPPPAPFTPEMFWPDAEGGLGLIDDNPPQSLKNAVAARYGVNSNTVDYWPDFLGVMEYAGYPKVGVTNGTATALLDAFLSNPEVASGTTLNCAPQDMLQPYSTLKLQVPVIFAGFCESWKALSNASSQHSLVYVGLANMYITRMWKTPDDYACGSNYVSVVGQSCQGDTFDPPLVSFEYQAVSENAKGMEGLVSAPQIGSAAAASIVKIFLVE